MQTALEFGMQMAQAQLQGHGCAPLRDVQNAHSKIAINVQHIAGLDQQDKLCIRLCL